MKVIFGNQSAVLFSIELDSSDTVLEMKQKIEKSYGIPVPSQTIFFKGRLFLPDRDSHTLQQCKIFDQSRLEIYFPRIPKRNRNISQVLQQTEQSPVPSTSGKDIIIITDSPERNQDSSVMDNSNNRQMLHQTEHSQAFFRKDFSAMPTYGQMLHQAMQSLVPSNATEGFVNQRWPAIARSNNDQMLQQTEQSPVSQAFFNQGWPAMARSNDDQMLQQTEQSMVPSNVLHQTAQSPLNSCSIDELLQLVPDMPVTAEDISKMQSWTAEGSVNIQESSGRNDNNQDFLQMDSSLSTESFTNIRSYWHASTTEEERINDQDLRGSSSQMAQAEKSPPMREVINSPDSPERSSNKRAKNLRVMVLPYSGENKPVSKLLVDVNESENVEELKIELVKMQQRSQLHLPEGGFFFIHKERVLDEKKSFRGNLIDHGDTIQIFPASVTDDERTDT